MKHGLLAMGVTRSLQASVPPGFSTGESYDLILNPFVAYIRQRWAPMGDHRNKSLGFALQKWRPDVITVVQAS
jgi:hypothetical protein